MEPKIQARSGRFSCLNMLYFLSLPLRGIFLKRACFGSNLRATTAARTHYAPLEPQLSPSTLCFTGNCAQTRSSSSAESPHFNGFLTCYSFTQESLRYPRSGRSTLKLSGERRQDGFGPELNEGRSRLPECVRSNEGFGVSGALVAAKILAN